MFFDTLKMCCVAVFIVLFFGSMYSCEKWRYDECRKVGHSTLYCVVDIGH